MLTESVEYLGQTAQTIAFLKRESYSVLDLKTEPAEDPEMLENTESQPDVIPQVDLSHQLQIVNLGYLGTESNIFELASTYVDFSFLPLFSDFKTNKNAGQTSGQEATQQAG